MSISCKVTKYTFTLQCSNLYIGQNSDMTFKVFGNFSDTPSKETIIDGLKRIKQVYGKHLLQLQRQLDGIWDPSEEEDESWFSKNDITILPTISQIWKAIQK